MMEFEVLAETDGVGLGVVRVESAPKLVSDSELLRPLRLHPAKSVEQRCRPPGESVATLGLRLLTGTRQGRRQLLDDPFGTPRQALIDRRLDSTFASVYRS